MDAITTLMEALKAGGPYAMAAIFIVGWWLERHDRGAGARAAGCRALILGRDLRSGVEVLEAL